MSSICYIISIINKVSRINDVPSVMEIHCTLMVCQMLTLPKMEEYPFLLHRLSLIVFFFMWWYYKQKWVLFVYGECFCQWNLKNAEDSVFPIHVWPKVFSCPNDCILNVVVKFYFKRYSYIFNFQGLSELIINMYH